MRSTACRHILISFVMLILVIAPAAAQDTGIGTIRTSAGVASVVRGGERIPAEIGARIDQGDVLETGGDGTLGIVFRDNATMTLGPNSHMTVDEFKFNPAQDEVSFFTTLLRGSVLYVSGVIGKLSRDSVALRTPVATVGMRGTRFLAKVGE